MAMDEIAFGKYGEIDWEANGWPEPNPERDGYTDGKSVDTMPDDVFDIWLEACAEEDDWGSDD